MVADGVAQAPVLGGLGLSPFFEYHLHESGDYFLALSAFTCGLVPQSKDTEHDVVEDLSEGSEVLASQFG